MGNSNKIDRIEMLSSKELVKESFKDVEVAEAQKKSVYSIPTYFKGLDSLILGLHKSDLIMVVGRPGTGKSAFAHHMIKFHSNKEYSHLVVFSGNAQRDGHFADAFYGK